MMSRQEHGFSLIEAMIAVAILTIGLLAMAQLVLVSMDKSEFAKYDTKAVFVAQGKVEELRALFGQQIDSGASSSDLSVGSHGPVTVNLEVEEDHIQGQRSFQLSWQISDLGSGRREVTVQVSPAIANPRQNETVTLTTSFSP